MRGEAKRLYFVTGNKNKFAEARQFLPELLQANLDLIEIQGIDTKSIISAKLLEARSRIAGSIIVEDTSLEFQCLNGLPGPLIKWFLKKMGNKRLAELAIKNNNTSAKAILWIGYIDPKGGIRYFSASLKGEIVSPKGHHGFGWDPIFRPLGHSKTLAEMTLAEKNCISMRAKAFEKLRSCLHANFQK